MKQGNGDALKCDSSQVRLFSVDKYDKEYDVPKFYIQACRIIKSYYNFILHYPPYEPVFMENCLYTVTQRLQYAWALEVLDWVFNQGVVVEFN